MKKISLIVILITCVALSGWAEMSKTEKRTLTGGAVGAGAGAVVGAVAGNTALGLVGGAAVGLAGGYLYDHHEKSKKEDQERAYQEGYEAGKKSPKGQESQ